MIVKLALNIAPFVIWNRHSTKIVEGNTDCHTWKKNAKLDPANYRPISPYYLRVQQAYRTCNAASFSQAKLFAEALSLRIISTRPLAKIILSNLTFPPLAIGDRAKTINRHTQAGVALAPSLS